MLFIFANLFNWLSDRSFRSPSTPYSAMRSLIRNSENPAPLFKRFFKSINDDIDAASFVISLNRPSRPYAIFRRIVFIVIDSFYRVFFGWSFSHIFQKIFKGFSPTFTYLYAATTIIFPTFIVSIFRSINHAAPYSIKRVSFSPFCKTVFYHPFRIDFSIITSARYSNFSSKINACRYRLISTITDAIPSCKSMLACFCFRNNSESSETLTCQIDKGSHNILRQNIPYNGVCGRLIRFQLFGSYPIHTDAYSKVGA